MRLASVVIADLRLLGFVEGPRASRTLVLGPSETGGEERVDAQPAHVPWGSPQAVASVGRSEEVLGIVAYLFTRGGFLPFSKHRAADRL